MAYDENNIVKLEEQVDDLLKQLDDMLKTHAAPGAPQADDADQTGSGSDNTSGHNRRVKLHDQQHKEDKGKKMFGKADTSNDAADDDVAKRLENIEGLLAKASKNGNGNGNGNGSDSENDDDEDDWSEGSDSTTKKRAEGATEDDGEAIVVKGNKITKAEAGPSYEILKSLSEDLAKAGEKIEKAENDALMATLRKRADDEYPHVPGTTDERALMLKSMSTMPEALRKSFEKVLTAHEKMVKAAFTSVGFSSGDLEDIKKNGKDFETKVAEIQKRDSCTRIAALEKARKEAPDLYKAFQGSN